MTDEKPAPEQEAPAASQHAAELSKLGASKGGKARASVLNSEERREIARQAVISRWRKAKGEDYRPPSPKEAVLAAKPAEVKAATVGGKYPRAADGGEMPYSMFPGTLHMGDLPLECHVLSDGRRVFTQRAVLKALTGGEGGVLQRYIANLPNAEKLASIVEPIRFRIPQNPKVAFGFEATALIEVCEAYLSARPQLKAGQKHLAKQAEIIIRACAKVGVIALVDEATGYQQYRAKQALQLKLQAFIAEDIQEWARMFPEEFWHELARLEGIHYSPRSRPLRWGKYVMAFVYDAVDKDVGRQLRQINPDPHFRQNHHQWLKEFGREKVGNQLQQVIGAMKTCDNIEEFKSKFARAFKKLPTQMALDFGEVSAN